MLSTIAPAFLGSGCTFSILPTGQRSNVKIYGLQTDHICDAGFPPITGSPDKTVMGLRDRAPNKLCKGRDETRLLLL